MSSNLDFQREQQAERLMAEANLWRTRGEPAKAEEFSAKAVEVSPDNAVARELHGDMLQLLGELEKALDEYKEAIRISPGKESAETKFARVTLALANEKARGSLDSTDPDLILMREAAHLKKRKPELALIYSLVIPGAGQFYNGEREKGVVLFGAWFFIFMTTIIPVVKFVLQIFAGFMNTSLAVNAEGSSLTGAFGLLLLSTISIYSAVEAYLIAKKDNLNLP